MGSTSDPPKAESAWPEVQEWLAHAKNKVEVLPRDLERSEATLKALGVTVGSALGAVALETAGLLIDDGWVRLLGGGSARLRGLAEWNGLDGVLTNPEMGGVCVVAHDAIGGFFALDGGALGEGKGGAYYFAPDSLDWENLNRGYSALVRFILSGDLQEFYGSYRWKGWRQDVQLLSPDRGFSWYPPLWTREGKEVERVSRRAVPMTELLSLQMDYRRTLEGRRG